jgi:hypothetical protein
MLEQSSDEQSLATEPGPETQVMMGLEIFCRPFLKPVIGPFSMTFRVGQVGL